MEQMLTSVKAWWSSNSVREQRLVGVCIAVLCVGLLYWGVIAPLNQRAELAESRIKTEKQLLSWVQNKANTIAALRAQGGVVVSSEPLNQVVSSSARRFNVDLIRVQPRSDMLQVWLQPIEFNDFINWIAFLQEQHGVVIEFMDIDRSDKQGVIEIKRLQLKRG